MRLHTEARLAFKSNHFYLQRKRNLFVDCFKAFARFKVFIVDYIVISHV